MTRAQIQKAIAELRHELGLSPAHDQAGEDREIREAVLTAMVKQIEAAKSHKEALAYFDRLRDELAKAARRPARSALEPKPDESDVESFRQFRNELADRYGLPRT